MDLTIKISENFKLNVRVAIIMQTEKGFVLHKGISEEHYALLGGRVKQGESSMQACIRETREETGLDIAEENFNLLSVIENFWTGGGCNYQEFCFVYFVKPQEKLNTEYSEEKDNGTFRLVEMKKEEIIDIDLRPEVIKQIILSDDFVTLTHHIV